MKKDLTMESSQISLEDVKYEVVKALLREVLKDGVIHPEEKESIQKMYNYIGVSMIKARDLLVEVKGNMDVDREGGSANMDKFLKTVAELYRPYLDETEVAKKVDAISDLLEIQRG